MNKILSILGAFAATTIGLAIGNIVQSNQKKKFKNQNAELQNEKNAIKEDNEALKKQYFDAEVTNKKLREENNQFREQEYKQQQQKKQREDEIKAIEDFELEDVNGLDDMEDI